MLGATKFWSIIFSNPLAIDATINNCGNKPKKVAVKKLEIFTFSKKKAWTIYQEFFLVAL